MKILVLTDRYPPLFQGGYELICKDTVEELANRGHQIAILTSRWGLATSRVEGSVYRLLYVDPILDRACRNRIPLSSQFHKRYNQFKWAFGCRRNYAVAYELALTWKPDLVFAWNMKSVGITPVLAAQSRGIPIVFNLLEYWLSELKNDLCLEPNSMKRLYRAAILGLADFNRVDLRYLLFCSRSLMQRYLELGFPEQGMRVIPPGVPSHLLLDTGDLRNLPQNKNGKVKLTFVGRLVPEKGADVAIRALRHLVGEIDGDKARLDIIGTGTEGYVSELKRLVTFLGLTERVEFLGMLEHQQVLDRFAEYDALLFTSRWVEPFGVTVIEAMARGLPVIATRCGGAADIISDGETGLLVPPDEPAMLANAIERLIQCPALSQEIRSAALKTVGEQYTIERAVDQIEEYLAMVVQQSAPNRTKGD